MVEDLLSIVHTFSGRLDGMRKYKKQVAILRLNRPAASAGLASVPARP
jgi:predicted site-specific integrase-resolvase